MKCPNNFIHADPPTRAMFGYFSTNIHRSKLAVVPRRAGDNGHSEFPTFLCSFEALDVKTFKKDLRRKKRYISKNKNELYRDSPHLTDTHSYQKNGYWIGTNIGRNEIIRILRSACKSCAVEFSFASRIKIE